MRTLKQCPKCRGTFSQLKKGACPVCGEALFYSSKGLKRESDKLLAVKMRETIRPVIEKNTQCGGYLMIPGEWDLAYGIIDMLRAWLNSQPIKLLTTDELVMAVVLLFLNDPYWRQNIRSLAAIKKQGITEAMKLYRELKLKQAKEEVQERRVANANLNNLHIEYN